MGLYGVTEDLQDEINDLTRENKKLLKKIEKLKREVKLLKSENIRLLELLDASNSG